MQLSFPTHTTQQFHTDIHFSHSIPYIIPFFFFFLFVLFRNILLVIFLLFFLQFIITTLFSNRKQNKDITVHLKSFDGILCILVNPFDEIIVSIYA
jgi:hypothetical protein